MLHPAGLLRVRSRLLLLRPDATRPGTLPSRGAAAHNTTFVFPSWAFLNRQRYLGEPLLRVLDHGRVEVLGTDLGRAVGRNLLCVALESRGEAFVGIAFTEPYWLIAYHDDDGGEGLPVRVSRGEPVFYAPEEVQWSREWFVGRAGQG